MKNKKARSEESENGPAAPALVRAVEGNRLTRCVAEPHLRGFVAFAAVLTLAFCRPLIDLARYAFETELHSHVLLIPFVSGYLIYQRRRELPTRYVGAPILVVFLLLLGLGALAVLFGKGREILGRNDALSLATGAYLCCLLAGAFLFMGRRWLRSITFPVFFLIFMVPLPDGVVAAVERGLVLASAEVTALLFAISGTPVYRTGKVFELPGIVLEVARECSGIRSSWVLFITSLLASYLILKGTWRRALIVGLVIPLGILRNGFRILVIGLLCVHYGPHMINSPVHKSGGPYFFALSLIPLFVLLWWLQRGEATAAGRSDSKSKESGRMEA